MTVNWQKLCSIWQTWWSRESSNKSFYRYIAQINMFKTWFFILSFILAVYLAIWTWKFCHDHKIWVIKYEYLTASPNLRFCSWLPFRSNQLCFHRSSRAIDSLSFWHHFTVRMPSLWRHHDVRDNNFLWIGFLGVDCGLSWYVNPLLSSSIIQK